jgi:hypothetical protein
MNEQEETKDCQRLILEALRGFKAYGTTEIDQENLHAAVKILSDLEMQQALLNLMYKGEISGRINDEDDVEFIAANSEAP